MTKSISGKQIKDFLDRFDEDELATMCANINTVMAEAAEAYYNIINKLTETYPELWIFGGFDTSVVSSDNVNGRFVNIHIGPGGKKING